MSDRDDEVVLTEWERERLAALEEHLAASDPRFTRRLARVRPDRSMLLGTVSIIAGWIVTLVFLQSLWLAVVGLLMMGAGAHRIVTHLLNPAPAGTRRRRSWR